MIRGKAGGVKKMYHEEMDITEKDTGLFLNFLLYKLFLNGIDVL